MTNEETIDVLEQRKTCMECVVNCTCEECDEAFDIAIKSLEAWEKIKAEIEQTAKDYDKFDDYRRVRGLWIALKIIDKYMKGVSEE